MGTAAVDVGRRPPRPGPQLLGRHRLGRRTAARPAGVGGLERRRAPLLLLLRPPLAQGEQPRRQPPGDVRPREHGRMRVGRGTGGRGRGRAATGALDRALPRQVPAAGARPLGRLPPPEPRFRGRARAGVRDHRAGGRVLRGGRHAGASDAGDRRSLACTCHRPSEREGPHHARVRSAPAPQRSRRRRHHRDVHDDDRRGALVTPTDDLGDRRGSAVVPRRPQGVVGRRRPLRGRRHPPHGRRRPPQHVSLAQRRRLAER